MIEYAKKSEAIKEARKMTKEGKNVEVKECSRWITDSLGKSQVHVYYEIHAK